MEVQEETPQKFQHFEDIMIERTPKSILPFMKKKKT